MEVALIAGSVSLVTAVLSAVVTVFIAEKRVRRDFALDFAAERVARELMMHPRWQWRSFRVIQHYLGGFDDDELRRILVRAGAIRHTSPKGSRCGACSNAIAISCRPQQSLRWAARLRTIRKRADRPRGNLIERTAMLSDDFMFAARRLRGQ